MKTAVWIVVISLLCFIAGSQAKSQEEQLFKLAHKCYVDNCDEVTILQLANLLNYYQQSGKVSEITANFARKVLGGFHLSKAPRSSGLTVNLTCETIDEWRSTFTCEISASAANGIYAVGTYPMGAECVGECTLFFATNPNVTITRITLTVKFQVTSFSGNISVNAAVVENGTYLYAIADRINAYTVRSTEAPTPASTPAPYQLRIGTYYAPTQVYTTQSGALQLTTSMAIYSSYFISYAFVSYLDQRGNSFYGDVHPYSGAAYFQISFSAQNVTPGVYCPVVLLMDVYGLYNTTYLRQCITVSRPPPTPSPSTPYPTQSPPTTRPSSTTQYPTQYPPTPFPTQSPPTRPPTNYPSTPYPTPTQSPSRPPTGYPQTPFPTQSPPTNYPTPSPSNYTYFPEGTLRLVPGPASGRLEIVHNSIWGTVCDDYFGNAAATIACRKLGFVNGTAVYLVGNGSGQIWLDDVMCNGTETDIANCGHNPWGTNDCTHVEDVSLACN